MNHLCNILEKMKNSQTTAIIDTDGTKITYHDLYYLSKSLSSELKLSTQNILVYLPNNVDYVISIFAIWFADKTVIPLNIRLKDTEINSIIEFCETDTIITDDRSKNWKWNLNIINTKNYKDIVKNDLFDLDNLYQNELAVIMATSGSLSAPKFVKLSHKNIIAQITELIFAYNLSESTSELIMIPLTSIAGLVSQLLAVMSAHGVLVLYDGPMNPLKILSLIKDYNVTITGCAPSLLALLTNFNDTYLNDLKSLKAVIVGGEKINDNRMSEISSKLNFVKIMQVYGLTEASSFVTGYLTDDNVPFNSVGRVLPKINIRVINECMDNCQVGSLGQIIIKGDPVTSGYYKNEELTTDSIKDGWFYTGDMGYLDENGYLFINGRIKNIIISGGQNIYPEEIEECLLTNECIQQAIVYAQENEILGQVSVAVVALKPNKNITEEQLFKYCNERLSNIKVPKKFIIKQSLDIIGLGKTKRIRGYM